MALVFGIKLSFDNTSHKFTSRNYIQGLRNIYLNCFNETECGKRREITIRKTKEGKGKECAREDGRM